MYGTSAFCKTKKTDIILNTITRTFCILHGCSVCVNQCESSMNMYIYIMYIYRYDIYIYIYDYQLIGLGEKIQNTWLSIPHIKWLEVP